MRFNRLLFALVFGLTIGATPAAGQTRAYVVTGNTLTVVDTGTDRVAGSIPVAGGPSRVVISRDGTRAYVLLRDLQAVSVVDTALNAVLTTIPLADSPSALAVTPDGRRVYVLLAGGSVQVIDPALASVVATIAVPGSGGGIAIAPDGSRAYVASGDVTVIDTAANTVTGSFSAAPGGVTQIAISPDGSRAYLTTNGTIIFGFDAGVVIVDLAARTTVGTVVLGALPGQLVLTPDGSRAYVGILAVWVDTGYGAAFIPGRSVAVLDTRTNTWAASIDLGADGPAWTQQNTAAGIAVTPDRSDVYVAVPRISTVSVGSVNTNLVRLRLPIGAQASALAIVPDSAAILVPYVLKAVPDVAPLSVPSTGAVAVANVLANDRIGGLPATLAHVTLSKRSSTDTRIKLNAGTGAVTVAAGVPLGAHSLAYKICEIGSPKNCAKAKVTLTVRDPFVIDAASDVASARPGTVAITSVLANDTLAGVRPTTANVVLSLVSSTDPGLTLNPTYGSVSVAPGTPLGPQSLVYRICEMADPANCDDATAAVTVVPTPLNAADDVGISTRSGGVAQGNVLANDTLDGTAATLARVTLGFVSSTHTGIQLAAAGGAITVAAATPIGAYSLVYRICERANPVNCDDATVTVTVNPYVMNAVNDSARASSKVAGIALASVLANDFLGSARATPANVRLSLISLTPASSRIVLDLSDGSVDVLGSTSSGLYTLVYEICEIEVPTNCDRGTVTLDLSGGA
jgi:YVTN family beta-propeller protein